MDHAVRLAPVSCLIAAIVLAAAPARAFHTAFSGTVLRFEGEGNVFDSGSGAFVDEFDDGTLEPHWAILVGSAVESGGVLTVQNPGLDVSFIPGVQLDISNVELEDSVFDGGGDFTVTSYWTPVAPALNRQLHFQIYALGSIVESVGMTISNLDPSVAAAEGAPAGHSVAQQLTFVGSSPVPPQSNVVGVDLSAVTGALVMRMTFDDATNLVTTSFSLDGGTTFQSPFPPIPAFNVIPDGEILLGANSVSLTGPPPSVTSPICPGPFGLVFPQLRLRRLGAPLGDETLKLKAKVGVHPAAIFPVDPIADGVQLLVEDYASATITQPWYDLAAPAIPAGAIGSGCDPRDGWRGRNGNFTYRNVSGAFPPACAPGSARGIRRVRIRDRQTKSGFVAINFVAKGASIPLPMHDQVRVGVVFGGPAEAALGWCGWGRWSCEPGPQAGRDCVYD